MARVPYLTPETATGEVAEILAKLRDRGTRMHLIEAVANSTGAFRNFVRFGHSLRYYTRLLRKLREIVILRLAERTKSPYEWNQHEPSARREGVTDDQIGALRTGDISRGVFDERELAVLRFADEAVEMGLADETFEEVKRFLDPEEIVDLVLTVGWWGGMAPRVIAALAIEPEAE